MNRTHRWCNVIVIGAALALPGALAAHAAPRPTAQDEKATKQDEQRAKKEDKVAKDEKKLRVYDAKHSDYHDWTDDEDRAYRRYLSDQHQEYRDYQKLNRDEQEKYWDWRHANPDRDDQH